MLSDQDLRHLEAAAKRYLRSLRPHLPIGLTPEDLVQEAFCSVFQEIRSGSVTDLALLPCLLRTLWCLQRGAWRKARRESGLVTTDSDWTDSLADAVPAKPAAGEGLDSEEELRRLARAVLRSMPEPDVQLFLLARIQGLGYRCAGIRLGLTDRQTECARKRISRFLSDPQGLRLVQDVLGRRSRAQIRTSGLGAGPSPCLKREST